ncbi:hypothetical protein NV379_01100 [Paenibacillus sp. N1-5-1-14]|uniref:hypothetical protein n=1 Tax=Paenibacillus radicibacter TaxID=2972488 RepID=UPI0021598289|nr:hypothetical protein [Paenibacillus radicibacter]MCR8641240.1 hypothetical protein [Paenibacillus radicibacter]
MTTFKQSLLRTLQLAAVGILVCTAIPTHQAYADTEEPTPITKPVREALQTFKDKFQRKELTHPYNLPFTITKSVGTIAGDQLELDYVNDKLNQRCKIFIRPFDGNHVIPEADQAVTLQDGTQAIMEDQHLFDSVKFVKGGWSYRITLLKNDSRDAKQDLMAIANSL